MQSSAGSNPLILTDGMRSPNKITTARAYTRAGLKLLVTHGINGKGHCTCRNVGCAHPGKHPIAEFFPHGALSGTTEMAAIRKALRRHPDANIATTTENLTVIDQDGEDAKNAFKQLGLKPTIGVRTARGIHKHFRGELRGGSFKGNQVDVLTGPSRYVMLPPSRHESGHTYRWLQSQTDEAAPVDMAILGLRKTRNSKDKPVQVKMIRRGERNDTLFKTACALRRRLNDDRTVLEMMKVMNQLACEDPLADSELFTVITSSGRYASDDEKLFGPPRETKSLPMEYLWYPYIPYHAVTLLAGDPGRGKSLLIALIVAIVTSGRKWPFSEEKARGLRVLVLSAEDNWARVTLPRFEKAGADIRNIHVMYKFRGLTNDRLDELEKEIESWEPDLVIIDTIAAYMADRDMHRQNEVGEFIARLSEMAEAYHSAFLILGHLNKQSSLPPLYRIVGSIGFSASIRSALFLGTDPKDQNRLALAHGKRNGSEKGRTVIFQLQGGGRHDVPLMQAVELSDATEDDILQTAKAPPGRPDAQSQEAEAFVLEFLGEDKAYNDVA